jgi:glutaredoxin-like protein
VPLLSTADQTRLASSLAGMIRPVVLRFFSRGLDDEPSFESRQILDELRRLSDRISVQEVDLRLDPERAATFGIDRTPAIAIAYEENRVVCDTRIRFLGAPTGYELVSLVNAVRLAGGRPSTLSEDSLRRLAEVDRSVTVRVFTTPTCSQCPAAVNLAHAMAITSPYVTAYAVEATSFPDLIRRYRVNGVPKTVVDDGVHGDTEILGALPESAFVEQVLARFARLAGVASSAER